MANSFALVLPLPKLAFSGLATASGVLGGVFNAGGIAQNAVLPKFQMSLSGRQTSLITLGVALKPFVGSFSGGNHYLTGTLKPLTGAFVGLPDAGGGVTKIALKPFQAKLTGLAYQLVSMNLTTPKFSAALAGKPYVLATMNASTKRPFTGSFTGLAWLVARLNASFNDPVFNSDFISVVQPVGTLNLFLPKFSMNLFGALGSSFLMTHVTNSIMSTVTTFDNYDYESMANINGVYYGASAAGLFVLDSGTTDNAAPVSWSFSIGEFDFGDSHYKRVTDFYMGMRSAGPLTVTPIVDESETDPYTIDPLDIGVLHQRRVFIGKGLRGKYWNFTVSNTNGNAGDVDSLDIAAVPSMRRI